jgi:hypothetical protein
MKLDWYCYVLYCIHEQQLPCAADVYSNSAAFNAALLAAALPAAVTVTGVTSSAVTSLVPTVLQPGSSTTTTDDTLAVSTATGELMKQMPAVSTTLFVYLYCCTFSTMATLR